MTLTSATPHDVRCGLTGLKPGERIMRFADTAKGKVVYAQQAAMGQRLDQWEAKVQENSETSFLVLAQSSIIYMRSPCALYMCITLALHPCTAPVQYTLAWGQMIATVCT